MVRVSFDLKRRDVFFIMGMVLFFGVGFVIAYNVGGSGGNPAVMGHSVDEMDWSKDISQICLNGVCITDWYDYILGTHVVSGIGCPGNETAIGYKTEPVTCEDPYCAGLGCTTGSHPWDSSDTSIETCQYSTFVTMGGGSTCSLIGSCHANAYTLCRS